MAEGQILIKDLPEATRVADSSFIPVDNGNTTKKISVGNFNNSSNQTAKGWAEAAAASAQTAQEAISTVDTKVDQAQGYANAASDQAGYASTYAQSAQTYAGTAQGYSNTAQGHATNAASSASTANSYSDSAAASAILSRSWAEGNTGTREGENTNNARYWANKAQTAAQITVDDHLDPVSTNPVENRAVYEALHDIHSADVILSSTMHIGGETQTNVDQALHALDDKTTDHVMLASTMHIGGGTQTTAQDAIEALEEADDEFTPSVTQANNSVVFDDLNPDYGYEIWFDDEGAIGDLTVPPWTGVTKATGTNSTVDNPLIKLTYTISGGTNGTSKFALRILK